MTNSQLPRSIDERLTHWQAQMARHIEAMQALTDQVIASTGNTEADSQHLCLMNRLSDLEQAVTGTGQDDLIATESELADRLGEFCAGPASPRKALMS